MLIYNWPQCCVLVPKNKGDVHCVIYPLNIQLYIVLHTLGNIKLYIVLHTLGKKYKECSLTLQKAHINTLTEWNTIGKCGTL